LPFSRFDEGSHIIGGVKAFLRYLKSGIARGAAHDVKQHKERSRNLRSTRRRMPEQEQKLKSIKRELSQKKREHSQIARELRIAKREANRPERVEQIRRIKSKKQEIFRLENKLRTAKARTEGEPETGSLPDFVIIGAPKCGTSFLYHLLTKHPHVEPAAFKEIHYFDLFFDKGTEWYRQCFPSPLLKDGRSTITGEATPAYLSSPQAPERTAEMIPQARLIALLRNPVDRAYSAYQYFNVRHGRGRGTFEETIETNLNRSPDKALILRQGIYVDDLLHWSKFFSDEQMLVLKSEDLFEHPQEILNRVLDFLDLPERKLSASMLRDKRNKGSYEQEMDASTRRWLEDYFEPHNRRLYEFLGVNFGW
jgi:hypothetical protein